MTEKTIVIPPWSRDAVVRYDPDCRRRFREAHGLADRFVVMYSGNHSPCHPLGTLLEAARRLREHQQIVFCFVGGGSEVATVERFATAHRLDSVTCLPYQPVGELSGSLSAADLHVVVMGDPYVGIIHPCKIYNILRLGIPFLYVGPAESYVTDLIPSGEEASDGWARCAQHDDVDLVASHVLDAATSGCGRSEAESQLAEQFSQRRLLAQLAQVVTTQTAEQTADLATTGR